MKYWVDRGYDVDIVRQRAAKMEHPTLGVDVYRVDVFSISQEHVQEQIEEKILSCSRDVKKRHTPVDVEPKKRAKGKGKGKDAAPEPPKPEPTPQEKAEKEVLKSMVIESDSDIGIVPCPNEIFERPCAHTFWGPSGLFRKSCVKCSWVLTFFFDLQLEKAIAGSSYLKNLCFASLIQG